MTRILGIDPGSRVTGFGVIEQQGNQLRYIASGCIRTRAKSLPGRLREIFVGLKEVVTEYQPDQVSIERVFVQRNVDSALKLGQARGAALCAVMEQDLPVHEYSPTQIKKAIVGRGHATKDQVQHMVVTLLKLTATPQEDAADALAGAICHAHTDRVISKISTVLEAIK